MTTKRSKTEPVPVEVPVEESTSKRGGNCPFCNKHFRKTASITKYHGWCAAKHAAA